MPTTDPEKSVEKVTTGDTKIETMTANDKLMADALKDLWGAAQLTEEDGTPEQLSAWSDVLGAAKDFDKDLVGNWKDDMSNMLIFCRQPPPEPFVPTHVAVRVNTLWFLSLAMNLIAALFAIVTQQWMRAYQDLGYMALREAVRLRELRYRSLHFWRVPEIINCVPILLQAALVLFLTGIWIILQPLNDTVFVPYATFVAVSFFIYATTVLMSTISPSCAYKSPLSYLLSLLLEALRVFFYYCVLGSIHAVMKMVQLLIAAFGRKPRLDKWTRHLETKLSTMDSKVMEALTKLPLESSSTAIEYWLALERNILRKRKDLDSSALSWVLPWLSATKLSSLELCLDSLETAEEKLNVVAAWLAKSLGLSLHTKFFHEGYTITSLFSTEATMDAMRRFGERHHKLLVDLLPDVWHKQKSKSSKEEPLFNLHVLALLRHFIHTAQDLNAAFKINYTRKLMRLRGSQASVPTTSPPKSRLHELRLPTLALFDCGTKLQYEFNDEEISTLVTWSKELYDTNRDMDRQRGVPKVSIHDLEPLLASTATASDAISRRPKVLENGDVFERYRDLLKDLGDLLASEPTRIAGLVSNAEDWPGKGVPPVIIPALKNIVQNLIALDEVGRLHRRKDGPATNLVRQLLQLFAREPWFQEFLPQLQALNGSFQARSPSIKSAVDVMQTPKGDTQPELAYDNTRIEKIPRDGPGYS
ncbi:hypothetical protein NM688_g1465 [Phlebia brevispora]|uniref:Uncharacterized protein n=1 Tax=Phlebia brevispora TaxID=194682 RepID=A0ACC1TBP6_9APHY|nr:hypothetical protein NM688_g1465 [Phlebia brevispora]